MKTISSRPLSLIICLIVYLITFIFVLGFIKYYQGSINNLWLIFLADIIATVIVFIFSVVFRNSSLYDPYWSVAPPLIALYWLKNGIVSLAGYLMLFTILIWAFRLTLNWIRGWRGLSHEDWRYKMLREKNPVLYPITNFAGIHLFPTLMVFLGMLPVYFVTSNADQIPLNIPVLSFGLAITLAATIIELVADEQMRNFKTTAKQGEFINVGLWKYSRHPNYFGEICFWMGLYIMQLAVIPNCWWTAIGFVAMLIMFLFASIPMMEEKNLKSKIGYDEYVKKVSVLIPWPVKK